MNDKVAKPVNGSYGTIDGVEIAEEVIARLVKNAEDGFPGAKFRSTGSTVHSEEQPQAVAVRLSESELAALIARDAN